MIVIDADVMVFALVDHTRAGDTARAAMIADDDWSAPAHMPFEVQRTLHKAVVARKLPAADADTATEALAAMQIEYVSTDATLLRTVWRLRHNVSVYDATYLAVAALEDTTAVTFDARLAKAAEYCGLPAAVRLLTY
ncbi:type II toxin-antitoxin system VapC family toxin [Nocardia puris]|uniref:type II toxin-antitoxin system VapC family toxin n=1 Tax=Nocardia puris TaxID=208602 RepID=UPI001893AD3C|nr:type II toxin-antitoxin system VapC family toxin [Nocardia puris]MBF6364488.1 type II toxin-antitoxin system VapC family toxin [Nocardia puris]MBF6459417.1 type II toxin-antitoxin system VapC family toxin [Nocardia puris]